MPIHTRHVGSYGLCVREESVLLIRKARGPYAGMLDLPGGGLEHGESPEMALRREFFEETGLGLSAVRWLCPFSHLACYRNSSRQDENLHHVGFIWQVDVDGSAPPTQGPDGQDSLGSGWYELATISERALSPVAQVALAALLGSSGEQPVTV